MKRLANLKNNLPKKSQLNKFQSLTLKGGGDKRRKREVNSQSNADGNSGAGG